MEDRKTFSLADMPSFDTLQSAYEDDAALDKELSKSGSRYFDPGKYEVEIANVEYTGPAKDPKWGKLQVTFKGPGEKEIRDTLLIPHVNEKYGDSGTLRPFKKLRDFGQSLGVNVTPSELKTAMKTLFSRPQKLVGSVISIDVGYQGAHLQYVRDSRQYQIVLGDGNVARDTKTMEALTFPDRQSAGVHASEQLKIELEKGVRVLNYGKSSSGANLAAEQGW